MTVHLRQPPAKSLIPLHRHPYGQLAFPERHAIRVTSGDDAWVVPAPRAIWIPPETNHELMMLGDVEFYVAYVEPGAAARLPPKCCILDVPLLVRQLVQSLAQIAADSGRRHKLLMDLLLEELRATRSFEFDAPIPSTGRLGAICEALVKDPASSLSLAQWAVRTDLSERTLARLFHAETGMSFGAWRQRLRLARAVELLHRGVSVIEIAAELGYANAGAFSTMFKRTLGLPPSKYRPGLR